MWTQDKVDIYELKLAKKLLQKQAILDKNQEKDIDDKVKEKQDKVKAKAVKNG